MQSQPPGAPQTLHIHYNHQCPRCKAFYIPFDEDVPCPQCGNVETKRFDFVTRAAESAKFNLAQNGTYLPSVWWVGSLGDFIVYMIFEVLEHHRREAYPPPVDELAEEILANTDMGDKPYLRPHVKRAAERVFEFLEQEKQR